MSINFIPEIEILMRTYLIKQEKPYTEIDPNDIELIESIGAGSYGSGTFSNFPLGFSESGIHH